ncbi:MAG TPA: sigma-70 family RNA polymerase sigma factor [Burkholderiales bacterium]
MAERSDRFEALALPHLNAAYNLARWLVRNDHDAQDVVQEAYLRALRFFDGFRGGDARPWLLSIVRNTCYTWLKKNRRAEDHFQLDEERDGHPDDSLYHRAEDDPEKLLLQKVDRKRLNDALEQLPPVFREVLILRELEELSYGEISEIVAIPIGTVMSRLARARDKLRAALKEAS